MALSVDILTLVLKFLFALIVSWMICRLMGLPDDVTAVLVVAASPPVGALIMIFAAEYKMEAGFISTAVVVSTALSPRS